MLHNGYVSQNKKYNRNEFHNLSRNNQHSGSPVDKYAAAQSTFKTPKKVQFTGTGATISKGNQYNYNPYYKLSNDLRASQTKFPTQYSTSKNYGRVASLATEYQDLNNYNPTQVNLMDK